MKPAIISDPALADLNDLVGWLAERSPKAAERAAETLFGAIGLLEHQPEMAPRGDGRFRELPVPFGRSGFIIRYTVTDDAVIIQRVFHGAQVR